MRYEKRTVSTNHPEHGELKFEVEVPQYDSVDEFVQASGGQEAALKVCNGSTATGAVNGARAYARNASETAAAAEIVEKARTVSKGYTPTGVERGPSKKEKLVEFDTMMARIREGERPSSDELDALAEKFGA